MPARPSRPAYHFSPARNWMNDPNGLVWYDGEYHLFFQYNPLGEDWGNMSWGHAVSPDLTHWEELPVALAHTDTEHVFSGSVVVDRANTSGLGVDGRPAMVAVYTSHDVATGRQGQSVAHSLDRGRTWTRHPGNPVLDVGSTDFRDPKVFWHAEGGYWVMVVVLAAERVVQLYRSDDLLAWAHLSDFGPAGAVSDVWECPDLFPVPVEDDPGRTRWVMVVSVQGGAPAGGSGMQYFVGDFDGTKFTADPAPEDEPVSWVDFGADYYAAVSFGDDPHGRRLLIGWMSNWAYAGDVPSAGFRGSMSLPRSYALRTRGGRLRLVQHPVVPGLPEPSYRTGPGPLPAGTHPLPAAARGTGLRVTAELETGSAQRLGLLLRVGPGERTAVGYDVTAGCVYLDRTASGNSAFHLAFARVHRAPAAAPEGLIDLDVYVDATSVEVFADDGAVVLTDQVFPGPDSDGVALFAEGGSAAVRRLTVTPVPAPTATRPTAR